MFDKPRAAKAQQVGHLVFWFGAWGSCSKGFGQVYTSGIVGPLGQWVRLHSTPMRAILTSTPDLKSLNIGDIYIYTLGIYKDNGKHNGNHYIFFGVYRGYIFLHSPLETDVDLTDQSSSNDPPLGLGSHGPNAEPETPPLGKMFRN